MATEKVKVFEEGRKASSIWLWLIPLLLLLGLAVWLLTRHRDQPNAASTAAVPASDTTKPDTGAAAGTAAATTWTAATIGNAIRTNGRVAFNDSEVHFATGSASLAGDSQTVLDQAAQALKDNNDWQHIRVVGHTDSVGSTPSNDQLAQQRAESVKAYLVSKGVDQNRLVTEEKGPRQPAATNATDDGRAENRRVELIRE